MRIVYCTRRDLPARYERFRHTRVTVGNVVFTRCSRRPRRCLPGGGKEINVRRLNHYRSPSICKIFEYAVYYEIIIRTTR